MKDKQKHAEISSSRQGRRASDEIEATKKDRLIRALLHLIETDAWITKSKSGDVYYSFPNGDSLETFHLNSPQLFLKIRQIAREKLAWRLTKPTCAEILDELAVSAQFSSVPTDEVYHRTARGTAGRVYIDLCNEAKDIVVIDKYGYAKYNYTNDWPLLLRPAGMTALPNPFEAPPNLELLRPYLNIHSETEWRLLIAYLLFSLVPGGPYPVLSVSGTAGSSKSTFCRVLRRLIDPSSVETQALPRSTDDLMLTARNSYLLVFDNVRILTHDISDYLCRIATGAGIRVRSLYKDFDEKLIHVSRPCILNGIGDVIDQPDLVSRAIQINLQPIATRRTEEEFNRSFESEVDAIFAGLLEALVKTLNQLPNVNEVPAPRMADFAKFGIAVERGLGWTEQSFMEAFGQNQRDQMTVSLGDDPVAKAIRKLVSTLEEGETHTETPTSLLATLQEYVTSGDITKKTWPESSLSLGKRLRKIEPALKACGIEVLSVHSGDRKFAITRLPSFKP